MSREHIVLLLTDSSLSIHLATRNASSCQALLPIGEAAHPLLRDWIAKRPHADFHLLLDLADEDFRHESIPHLTGPDERAFLARKLEQAYLHTPYQHSLLQRDTQNGDRKHALLSAITRPEEVDRLVTLLLQEKCALLGIYSVALASHEIYLRLGCTPDSRLLISRNTQGVIRQSYFSPQGLRLSRLVHIANGASASLATQTRQLHQYLFSLNAIAREQTLHVHLLQDNEAASAWAEDFSQAQDADVSHFSTRIEPVARLASKLGFTEPCASGQALLLSAIARGWIHNHYAPAPARRYFLLRRLKQAIQTASMLLIMMGVTFTGVRYSVAREQHRLIEETQQQIQIESARHTTLQADIRRIPAFEKQADIALYQTHLAHWPDVEQSAQRISQILLNYPFLLIDSFTWHAHTSPHLPDDDAIESLPSASTDTPRWQIITLSGHIASLEGDYRRTSREMDQCLSALASLPRSTVSLRKSPLDMRPQSRITQQALEEQNTSFVLRIVLAPEGNIAR